MPNETLRYALLSVTSDNTNARVVLVVYDPADLRRYAEMFAQNRTAQPDLEAMTFAGNADWYCSIEQATAALGAEAVEPFDDDCDFALVDLPDGALDVLNAPDGCVRTDAGFVVCRADGFSWYAFDHYDGRRVETSRVPLWALLGEDKPAREE